MNAIGAAVLVEGVWKRYTRAASPATIKSLLLHPGEARRRERFWALQDVNIDMPHGETLAIVGANGSGKSTLLRMIGWLGRPTRGRIRRGRAVGAMMTLGESFDPLLTGRENAITAGIVAGSTRREAEGKLPEIAAFAELEEFLDSPLRMYSDGMRLRLAFAVAISTRPEIMLIDEVLAVGDLRFQEKCFNRLAEMQDEGVTIVLASHDEGQVLRLAHRALWLAHGRVQALGPPSEVYDAYRSAMRIETERRIAAAGRPLKHGSDELAFDRFGTLELEISAVRIEPQPVERPPFDGISPVKIEIEIAPSRAIEEPIVGLSLHRLADGAMVFNVTTDADGARLGTVREPTKVTLVLDRLDIEPGVYRLAAGVYEKDWAYTYDYHWVAYPVTVRGQGGFGPPRRWTCAPTSTR